MLIDFLEIIIAWWRCRPPRKKQSVDGRGRRIPTQDGKRPNPPTSSFNEEKIDKIIEFGNNLRKQNKLKLHKLKLGDFLLFSDGREVKVISKSVSKYPEILSNYNIKKTWIYRLIFELDDGDGIIYPFICCGYGKCLCNYFDDGDEREWDIVGTKKGNYEMSHTKTNSHTVTLSYRSANFEFKCNLSTPFLDGYAAAIKGDGYQNPYDGYRQEKSCREWSLGNSFYRDKKCLGILTREQTHNYILDKIENPSWITPMVDIK